MIISCCLFDALTESWLASIVLVHGLTGNPELTWAEKKHDGTIWSRDLLSIDMPIVRVLTFGYDVDVVRLVDVASSNPISDHGKALATDLAQKRLLGGNVGNCQSFIVLATEVSADCH